MAVNKNRQNLKKIIAKNDHVCFLNIKIKNPVNNCLRFDALKLFNFAKFRNKHDSFFNFLHHKNVISLQQISEHYVRKKLYCIKHKNYKKVKNL